MKKELILSIHELVDFLLRSGDIDNRIYNEDTMNEGSRLHKLYQSRQGYNYLSEYYLEDSFIVDDFNVILFGRADGIILGNIVTIDEIKTTISDLSEYYALQKDWHLGQAKCYAYMYAKKNNLDNIDIKLTYINQLDAKKMEKYFSFTFLELQKDIIALIREYLDFYLTIFTHRELRNKSANKLEFPFSSYRKGQRTLAKYSYGIALNGGILFAEAPTGSGKTMSTLFPFSKSFQNENIDRIFYLTAKNSGKLAASLACDTLKDNGLDVYKIIITAKDKICFNSKKACNPDDCPFAKGYYSKIRKVIIESIKENNNFDEETIVKISRFYAICPFELSLDLSLFMDIIICDYNYFFDPFVYLTRFFDSDSSKTLVLIDEAHNLLNRGQDSYSVSFNYLDFKLAKKCYRHFDDRKIKNASKRISKLFNSFNDYPLGESLLDNLDNKSLKAIDNYLLASSNLLKNHPEVADDNFRDFFFKLLRFQKLYELFDDTFNLYIDKKEKKYLEINLYCLDPSSYLRKSLNKIKGAVLFSATLSPRDYYLDLIGGRKSDPQISLDSPFKKENMLLLVAPNINIKYKKREKTYQKVVSYINEVISLKIGNYFVYVPSYQYIEEVKKYLNFNNDVKVLFQSQNMSDLEKEEFLSNFVDSPSQTTVAFSVLGGIFGEGIDLVSERLIGIIVVGVGLPQISFKRNLIKDYFDKKKDNQGFNYAYLYPGINKVLQAMGRLIRSEHDRGVVLLIDDRYLTSEYSLLFARRYEHYQVVTSNKDIRLLIERFYNNCGNEKD